MLSAAFGKTGTVVNADASVVNFFDSDVISYAENYTSIVASVRSSINVKNSNLSTVAPTSVIFSAQEGTFELSSSSCKVTGSLGRIAELFNTQSRIASNSFYADLNNSANESNPIYSDKENIMLEYYDNSTVGF